MRFDDASIVSRGMFKNKDLVAINNKNGVNQIEKLNGSNHTVSGFDYALLYILPLFALTTLLQRLPLLSFLNRAMAFIVLAVVFLALFKTGMSKWKYALLGTYLAVIVISCGLTQWSGQTIAEAPRGIFCVTLLLYFHEKRAFVERFCFEHVRYLHAIVAIWTILVAISIPMGSSWVVQWGGSKYFCSYVKSAFQLMPTAILILSLDLVMLKIDGNSMKALTYCVIPLFAGLQGGSRTYFVLVLAMALLILLNCKLSKMQLGVIVALAFCVIAYEFAASGIASKIQNVSSSEQMSHSGMGVIGTLTSGRSEFWVYDLKAFFNLNILQQFVGNGFSFSYAVNLESVGNSIFAHDDFINLLMESGYIGLFTYLVSISCVLKIAKNQSESRIIFFLIAFIWLFNATVNSFYPYASCVIALVFTIGSLSLDSPTMNVDSVSLEDMDN